MNYSFLRVWYIFYLLIYKLEKCIYIFIYIFNIYMIGYGFFFYEILIIVF